MNVGMDVQLTLCNKACGADIARKLAQTEMNSLHMSLEFRLCNVTLFAVVARVNFADFVFVAVVNV